MDYKLANSEVMCVKPNVLVIRNYENYAQKWIIKPTR
jgi:hypothetical protein